MARRCCEYPWAWTKEDPLGKDDPTAAGRLLRGLVADLATGVGLAIRTARSLNLPVEPGVREGRDALIRWAVLLEELLP